MSDVTPKKALLKGAFWTLASRWSVRLLGFVNTMVMARLIRPEDYGIVAMAMLVVGLVQTLLDTGTGTAILRMKEVTRDDLDSAWTLRLMEFMAAASVLALVAYPAALYFKDFRVTPILLVFAGCIAIQGFATMCPTIAQRELNFSIDFRIAVIGKLTGVLVTVAGGFYFRDYRALVAGIASSYLISTLLTYLLHPYRSTWNTTKLREIWHVTKWITFSGMASFTLRKGDEFIAARVATTQNYGYYNVGADLGQMPTGEVGPAIMRSFLPVLSTIQADVERTRQAVLKTLLAINTLIAPIGAIFSVMAVPATLLLLGHQWEPAARIVAVFAVLSSFQIMLSPLNTLLTLRGHTKVQSHIVWQEFLVFVLAAIPLVPAHGIVGLAFARLIGVVANCTLLTWNAWRHCGISPRDVLLTLARPWLGAALTALAVYGLLQVVDGVLWQILAGSVSAGLLYASWCALTWQLVGRPEGLESTVLDRLVAWRHARAAG